MYIDMSRWFSKPPTEPWDDPTNQYDTPEAARGGLRKALLAVAEAVQAGDEAFFQIISHVEAVSDGIGLWFRPQENGTVKIELDEQDPEKPFTTEELVAVFTQIADLLALKE